MIVLYGETLNSTAALLDVQQGIILGPLLFRVYKKICLSNRIQHRLYLLMAYITTERSRPNNCMNLWIWERISPTRAWFTDILLSHTFILPAKASSSWKLHSNTEILPNFLVYKFCGNAEFQANCPKLCRNCAFPQKFHTSKLGEIRVFCIVPHTSLVVWQVINIALFYLRWKNAKRCNIHKTFFARDPTIQSKS